MFSKLGLAPLGALFAGCCMLLAQQVAIHGTGGKINLSVSNIGFSSMTMVNCVASPVTCGALNMSADPYSTNGHFAGYADPSERMDPLTGRLWVAYSWPTVLADGSQVVNTHVSFSNDHGATWSNSGLNYGGVLYATQQESNCVAQQSPCAANDSSHEVVDIYPQVVGASVYWYGIHSHYDVPQGGSAATMYSYTEYQVMTACQDTTGGVQGPMCLSSASPQYNPQLIGYQQDNQPSYFPVSVNLTSVSGLTARCTSFREPSFIMQNVSNTPTLYLFINCGDMTSYAQFSTSNPQSNIGNWAWAYSGSTATLPNYSGFATQSDAQGMCQFFGSCKQANYLTQTEVALAAGSPGLAAGTPIELFDLVYMSGSKIALGTVVTALATVSPPTFVRTSTGAVRVYAVIPSTDSVTAGPGTATYDPASTATGVVVAHKLTNCTAGATGCDTQGGEFTYLVSSGAKP
ncbi:MAG: hypothetical protein ABSH50_02925 [Bryobacteraceae bacterium]